MTIRILNGTCGRPINAAIMSEALLSHHTLSCSSPFVSFSVSDWTEFLNIVWRAYALCSRDSRGAFFGERMPVKITMPDGREFHTDVWYDKEAKGLRYVSLR